MRWFNRDLLQATDGYEINSCDFIVYLCHFWKKGYTWMLFFFKSM